MKTTTNSIIKEQLLRVRNCSKHYRQVVKGSQSLHLLSPGQTAADP